MYIKTMVAQAVGTVASIIEIILFNTMLTELLLPVYLKVELCYTNFAILCSIQ